MYSSDIRWRAVTLVYVYGVELEETARVLGVSARAISRWDAQFQLTGHVLPKKQQARQRYPTDVLVFISSYVKRHPCFFVDELRAELKLAFCGRSLAVSHSTILRALWFDLKLSRKVLERRAREAIPLEIIAYQRKMAAFYSYPEQVVFVDETSKNGKDSARKYAWSRRGTKAIVSLPFSRGNRVSVLAACDCTGFIAWSSTRGTYTRKSFHHGFLKTIIPKLNPWPLPRSIVVIDNARIHMYAELASAVEQCGAILLYLPPYCPQFNPIEVMFGRLKQWLTRHANLAFPLYPELVLEVAMRDCLKREEHGRNLFRHCGYDANGLNASVFEQSN